MHIYAISNNLDEGNQILQKREVSETEAVLLKQRLGVLAVSDEHKAIADVLGVEFLNRMEDCWNFETALSDIYILQDPRPDMSDLELARSLREGHEKVKKSLDPHFWDLLGLSLRPGE